MQKAKSAGVAVRFLIGVIMLSFASIYFFTGFTFGLKSNASTITATSSPSLAAAKTITIKNKKTSSAAKTPASKTPSAEKPASSSTWKQTALAAASYGKSQGLTTAIAVLDTTDGDYFTAGLPNQQFSSASIVKVFIFAALYKQSSLSTKQELASMISTSDDNIATKVYYANGGAALIQKIINEYKLKQTSTTSNPAYWGQTKITAHDIVYLYAALEKDKQLGPPLLKAMESYSHFAADGFDQTFGLPTVLSNVAIKQGWMCCLDNRSRMHTTGFIGPNHSTIVAILTDEAPSLYDDSASGIITKMTQILVSKANLS